MVLETAVTDDILLNRFMARLLSRLENQAVLATEDFRTVVSTFSRIFRAEKVVFIEQARKFQELTADISVPRSSKNE